MSDGSWFHADGAKDWRPKFVELEVETTMRSPRVDDHSQLLPLSNEIEFEEFLAV